MNIQIGTECVSAGNLGINLILMVLRQREDTITGCRGSRILLSFSVAEKVAVTIHSPQAFTSFNFHL